MGVSVHTVMVVQARGDDVKCFSSKKCDNGKYFGYVELWKGGSPDHLLLNTKPIYDTPEEVIIVMEGVVEEIRKFDLEAHAKKKGPEAVAAHDAVNMIIEKVNQMR